MSRRIIQEFLQTKLTVIDGFYLFPVKENDLMFVIVGTSSSSPLEMYYFLNHFIGVLKEYFVVSETGLKDYFDLVYQVTFLI